MSSTRVNLLASGLVAAGLDAYVAQTASSLGYLHGFPEDSHERFMALLVHSSGDSVLICPALSAEQARRAGINKILPWKDGEDPMTHFQAVAENWKLRSAIFAVDNQMPAKMLLDMQGTLPAALFRSGGRVFSELTRKKSDEEIALLKAAARIADESFLEVLPQLGVGMTEIEIQGLLEGAMKSRGGDPSFCIVAVGTNSAEPHHLNDLTKTAPGEILLMDFGCSYQGYHSDITRTVCIGNATDEMKYVYETVFMAHQAARQTGSAGVPYALIDASARGLIEARNFGEFFTHRTGHGIGRQVHEEPNVSSSNQEPVQSGDTFSIEPGIYLTGKFGVRIENIVHATPFGLESLNEEPSPFLLEIL